VVVHVETDIPPKTIIIVSKGGHEQVVKVDQKPPIGFKRE